MILSRLKRAGTGLAAGALLTTPLLGLFALGWWAGVPFVPYTVFEWLIKVLPGRVVVFGLDTTLAVLRGLGLDVKDTAKTAEQVLAVVSLFVAAVIVAALFFVAARPARAGAWGDGASRSARSSAPSPRESRGPRACRRAAPASSVSRFGPSSCGRSGAGG